MCCRLLFVSNKGNVEKWLLELQSAMRLTIKDVVVRSMEAYPKTPRAKWVLDWAAQAVLNVSQVSLSGCGDVCIGMVFLPPPPSL